MGLSKVDVVPLLRHSNSGGASAHEIVVEVARAAAAVGLAYIVRGDIRHVRLPERRAPARTDGLWQHTCFEAFLRGGQSAEYWEFNLSPSREWAAYRFNGYRAGMAAELALADPGIEVRLEGSELRLSATIDLSGLRALAPSDDWRLGLSAIIENEDGGKSWWGLAHPPGKPDFHHADSFVLTLRREEDG